jgi:hypothetical protein
VVGAAVLPVLPSRIRRDPGNAFSVIYRTKKGWRRIGIVLSVIWFLGFGGYANISFGACIVNGKTCGSYEEFLELIKQYIEN